MAGLSLLGTLPIALINPGLAATVPTFNAKIAKLNEDILKLNGAIQKQIEYKFAVGFQNPISSLLALQQALKDFAAQFPLPFLDPANWVTAGYSANFDAAVQLGLVDAQIAIVGAVTVQLQLGLSAGGIAAWTYTGPAQSFGIGFPKEWGATKKIDMTNGIVLIAESLATWKLLGESINTGTSADRTSPSAILEYLGQLGGGEINLGVLRLSQPIFDYLLELQGLRVNLLAQIQVTLGLNLPDISALLAALAAVDLTVAVTASLGVGIDITAEIDVILADIVSLELTLGTLIANLSATGPQLWSFSGDAEELGPSIADTFKAGVPSGTGGPSGKVYALVLASSSGSDWSNFGQIMKVA